MLNVDEGALECDLAETYHIYDYRELPLKKVALFSVGLRDDSRIKLKISGQGCSFSELLLASIADRLAALLWIRTGAKKTNMPDFIAPKITSSNQESNNDVMTFTSGDDFERKRKQILEGGER